MTTQLDSSLTAAWFLWTNQNALIRKATDASFCIDINLKRNLVRVFFIHCCLILRKLKFVTTPVSTDIFTYLLYKLECSVGITTIEKDRIAAREKLPYFFTCVW